MRRILVTGGGGFIGHHLITKLKEQGHWVRGVDLKWPEFGATQANDFKLLDLRYPDAAMQATRNVDEVYNLAADMGGIGYITSHLADIARNNTLININMLEAAAAYKVDRYLYSSSACVYPHGKQTDANVVPLREEDAYPADPEKGYGWEKLYAEELCKYYQKDYGVNIRIVRFHNVYGPLGTYDGGKEKSPAALCRKIAMATSPGSIEIWGDGQQTRSYMFIADCVEGLIRLMASDYTEPLNLGTSELVTIDALARKISGIACKTIALVHDTSKPQGVRGRNSDNSECLRVLGWEPSTPLDLGLIPTFAWIKKQVC